MAVPRMLAGIDYGLLSALLSRIVEVSEDSGVVGLATTSSVTDPTKNWAVNDWAGAKVHIIHGDVEYVRTIASNTSNTLVFSPSLPEAPSAGDSYAIRRAVAPFDMQDRVARVLGQLTDGSATIVPAKTGQLPASLTASGNLKAAVVEDAVGLAKSTDISATQPRNITQIAGTALTGRDWSGDLAKLQNLDVALSEMGNLVLHASTTTPLAANGSWTSAVDSTTNTGRLVGSVFADQAGTLYIEQSPDNTNWDVVDSFSVSANAGLGFSVEKVVPYIRVRYVNGATAQTVFRLYAYRRLRVR
jgi:hypothetical protein